MSELSYLCPACNEVWVESKFDRCPACTEKRRPNAYDAKIVNDLQALLDTLGNMRNDLYNKHPGCSCDTNGLCSHHATIYNRLITVADELARAIKDAQREG